MRRLGLVAAAFTLVACGGGSDLSRTGVAGQGSTGTAGTSSGAGTSGTAGTSGGGGTNSSAGSTTGAAGTASAGTAGGAGGAGGGAAGTTGGSGTAGAPVDGGADGPSGVNGDGSIQQGDGPTTTAGCSNHNYQLCIDFENGIDTTVWSGGTPNAIVSDQFAHGGHSYHLYSSMAGVAKGGRLLSKTVGTIKNQVWARFYIRFSPGAPGGHGNIVAAYDQSGTWYEMGYQFDGMMGVWHGGGGEHPRRSLPFFVDQWYCVEAYFDGANAAMPRWWIDGTEASYWNPIESCGTPMVTCPDEMYTCTNGQIACGTTGTGKVQSVVEAGPTPAVSTQFVRMEAGFTPYAGLALVPPNNVGNQGDTRVLNDLWIDDIAFDTQRIGCIE
jgi:hypothetical protein